MNEPTPALDRQIGGDHYKKLAIQPVVYCHRNNMGPCEFSAIKYLTRWKDKGGVEDLRKAVNVIEQLIQMEEEDQKAKAQVAQDFTISTGNAEKFTGRQPHPKCEHQNWTMGIGHRQCSTCGLMQKILKGAWYDV